MSFFPPQEMHLSFATVWICLRLHFKQSRNPRPQTESERAVPFPVTGLLQQEEQGGKGHVLPDGTPVQRCEIM